MQLIKVVISALTLVLALALPGFAENYPHSVPGEYIVKYNPEKIEELRSAVPGLRAYPQSAIRRALSEIVGLREKQGIPLIAAHVVERKQGEEFDLDLLLDLLNDGLLEYVEPNYVLSVDVIPNDPHFNLLWGLKNTGQSGGTTGIDIGATTAWDVTTGSTQVVVAVIDTGVDYNHPDLAANIARNLGEVPSNGVDDDGNGYVDDYFGWNAIAKNGNPMDDHGHGTHVAGTIAAVGNNAVGVTGVSWRSKILPVKFLDSMGSGTTNDAIDAIHYAIARNVDVINASWGGGSYSVSLRDAIQAANGAGILFVAAAGNNGSNNDLFPHYPSGYNLPNVIAVASITRNGTLSSFSNYGATTVHLAAPGSSITSTIPGGGYATMSGTSMAAPHVSGAAALLLSKQPSMTVAGIKTTLFGSIRPLASTVGKLVYPGMVNAGAALSGQINNPPQISSLPNITIDSEEGSRVVTVNASDPDGDPLTYSASVNPADSQAYQLDSTLGFWSSGEYYFNSWGYQEKWIRDAASKWYYIVPDGSLYRFDNLDSMPLIAQLAPSYYSNPALLYEAADSYSAPATVSFNGNKLTITPTSGFVGTFEVVVTVSDGELSAQRSFNVTVKENRPPVLSSISNKFMESGSVLKANISASDPDGDPLSFIVSTSNDKVTGTVSTGLLTLHAAANFLGEVSVTVTVSDGRLSASRTFTVSVVDFSGDSDGDGIPDFQEIEDGTDPFDPGSFLSRPGSPSYALWNGFLSMTNILELVNTSYEDLRATVYLYKIDGSLGHSQRYRIPAQRQVDVHLNTLPGFKPESYGIVAVEFSGALDGRLSYYRPAQNGGFEFAFSVPLASPTYGVSGVGFNTYQPSRNPVDQDNVVTNWLSIVNLSADVERFTVETFDQVGNKLVSRLQRVPAFGRVDLDGGHGLAGASVVGYHRIVPHDTQAPYIAHLVRYGGRSPAGVYPNAYDFAFPLIAKAGNGQRMQVPISRKFDEENWVEVVNAGDKSVRVQLTFRSNAGRVLWSDTVHLARNSQQHFYATQFLVPGETGFAVIEPDTRNSIIAQSMFYFRESGSGSVRTMYGSQAREALGQTLVGSYNLFLGMQNWLKLSNTSDKRVDVSITVDDGTRVAEQRLAISAYGSYDLAVHGNGSLRASGDSYGVLVVQASKPRVLVTELLRVGLLNGHVDFAAPTEVR